jgi:peptidoglycan/xylan/chitin deacetylase (PgdA/CDA1 family)
VVLCYHRVLREAGRAGDGRPYLQRGTAVGDRSFRAQMRALRARFDVLSESEVLQWRRRERELARPSCWITFDDGYRDVVDVAAPVLTELGLPATVFVTTATLEDPTYWLPADRWYATLTAATRARGVVNGFGRTTLVDLKDDYARWVDGPERRSYLRASSAEQRRMLGELAIALGAGTLPPPALYLRAADLTDLVSRHRWTVGGHGHTHAILTQVAGNDRTRELVAPRAVLSTLGLTARVFAYPDGAYEESLAGATRGAGWDAAVVLDHRRATRTDDTYALPRFIVPDDPDWVERHLLTSMEN